MALFKEVADIQTADMLNLPVPKAKYETVVCKPSDIHKEMVEALGQRADAVRSGAVDASQDNMLLITNDGRKLALDQRLLNPLLPDMEGSKVNVCAEKVYQIWKDTQKDHLTQLVFCDLSTPKSDGTFSVYNDLKNKLMARGIPEEEIAFVHSAANETQKQQLFGKVRAGQVRVLLGSTAKMGAGTNVQDKPTGLLVITDTILNRVTLNWKRGKRTHVFIDEFHVVFENEQSGIFFNSAWRQFRKRGAYPTAITQNVEYLLDSVQASTMLSNSEFIVMLNQAASDREKLSKLLNISKEQMSYVTNADAGCGLLRYGSALVPFVNRFPKDTKLYQLMTTKPGEGVFGGAHG